MAEISPDGKTTKYNSYEEYVNIQDSRYHSYDCPNCLKINEFNLEVLLKHNKDIKTILDVGCRDSAYFDSAKKKGIVCHGIDISPRSVEYAKSKGRKVIQGDINNLLDFFGSTKFNAIISSHSFEHFLDHNQALKNIRTVLEPNGIFLIRLPNETIISDTKRKAHTRAFIKDELIALLNNNRFKILEEKIEFKSEYFFVCSPIINASINDFPLYTVTKEWEELYTEVLKNRYVKTKYNRKNRLQDKIDYVNKWAPEIKKNNGNVLDIGPGPGEFLEVARFFGNLVKGIDSKIENNQMGNEYVTLSKLMTKRQNIPVQYVGFENMLKDGLPYPDEHFSFINSQGSIEQVFSKHLSGVELVQHKNCFNLTWTFDAATEKSFIKLFSEIKRILCQGGIFLLYANGAKNVQEYITYITKKINETRLNIIKTDGKTLHKIQKV